MVIINLSKEIGIKRNFLLLIYSSELFKVLIYFNLFSKNCKLVIFYGIQVDVLNEVNIKKVIISYDNEAMIVLLFLLLHDLEILLYISRINYGVKKIVNKNKRNYLKQNCIVVVSITYNK